jgi:hypothetical protein
MSADLTIEVKFGALSTIMSAEGQSWNPDVADDMSRRVVTMMTTLVAMCTTANVLHLIPLNPRIFDFDDYDDDEEADT